MSKVSEAANFYCSVCERSIDADLVYIEHYTQDGTLDRRFLHSVADYGSCRIAEEAARPGLPTAEELANCPIFKSDGEAKKHNVI